MLILIVILGVVLGFFGITYNLFIRDRNLINEAWSGIDVQLKRRYDLIPNIVASVKGYMQFEKNVMEEVTALRTQAVNAASLKEKIDAENKLSGTIKNLFAVAENYPDLKSSQNFLDLVKNLTEVEDQIQLSRRYYNGTVRDYNIRVESFPSNLVAMMFGFKTREFFEIEFATERAVPEVKIA